jgi:sphingomyelin phosphodiesterase acid-like 3
MLLRVTLFFAVFMLALSPATAQTAEPHVSHVVLLSDIHFDPLPSPDHCAAADGKAVVSALTGKPAERWSADDFHLQAPFALGHDSTYALMESALAAAHNAAPDARLVLVPGDLLAHKLRKRWSACLDNPALNKPERFTHFAASAMNFVLGELAANFPGAQIVPVLGNNDSDMGDYAQPSPQFLHAVQPRWRKLAGQGEYASFGKLGYFSVPLAGWPHVRVLALNSVAWSPKFSTTELTPSAAGEAELKWMQTTLAQARAAHDRVIVLGHIPPGLDAYASRQSDGKHIVSMFNDCGELGAKPGCDDFARKVPELMARFASTIEVAVFGHTHQNEFRLVGAGASAIPLQIVPSISPIAENNPAFLVTDAGADFAWRDMRAWDLPISAGKREWTAEYDFDRDYAQPAWNAAALEALVSRLKKNDAPRKEFFGWMSSGNLDVTVPAGWQDAYICGLDHLTAATAVPCVAESQLDLPLP